VKAVEDAKDRSPDLRLFQPPSQRQAWKLIFSGLAGPHAKHMQAMTDFLPSIQSTMMLAGALTVAGQWRSFTAFPSILAITVVKWMRKDCAFVMSWNEFP
jgi:hypothetical protein